MKELTKAQEQIMQILWGLKKGFIKDVLARSPEPKPAYNTVSTIVRILETNGFITHKAYGRTYEYYLIVEKSVYSNFYLKNFVGSYFEGAFQKMVSFFARKNDINSRELEEMMKYVEKDIKNTNSDD